MNKLQRVESKHIRWFLRRNGNLKYSTLKWYVRSGAEYQEAKREQKNFKLRRS